MTRAAVILTELFTADDVISVYTRAQAIDDGVLVDLMQPETVGAVREAGFKWPVAMTAEAFAQTVAVPEGSQCCDLQGRLWDVLWMLKLSIRESTPEDQVIPVGVRCFIPESPNKVRATRLKAVCGPGDDGEPVITIMLPDQD